VSRSNDERWAWLNQFQIIDEVLPLREGPGLVVRHRPESGRVRWSIALLSDDGGVNKWIVVPFEGRSIFARLSGDVWRSETGEQSIVLLESDRGRVRPAKPAPILRELDWLGMTARSEPN
jgi:hypothetical protein